MRITDVASTDLFTGTTTRPLQIVRITLVNDGPGMLRDLEAEVHVSVQGPGVTTGASAIMSRLVHGEERTVEVGVQIGAPVTPGSQRQVTVVAVTPAGRSEAAAQITVAEPGWTMWMVSHFHYDPVWWNSQGQFLQTWPHIPAEDGSMPEVRAAFELMRLHLEQARSDPDYKFVLAEIDYLKPYFDASPTERADLLELIKAGRIEIVGGSYNEPNTNLTCAESTIRNAVYGMAFQRDVLGAAPTTTWMLDAFGFDPSYPGLMAAAGMAESSWARGPFHQWGPGAANGGNRQMQFANEFEWLSPDGSGLLTSYMPNHYSAGWITQHAADLATAERDAYVQFSQLAAVAATRNVLLPVGGDHVVPSRWSTAIHRDWNARYVWPRFVTSVPSEYFAAVRSDGEARGAWFMPQTRDMNPIYPGKDVTYIDTKQAQRDAEVALLDGERLATLAWLAGARYPTASIDKAWRLLVFGAHHDAITGTEGDQVYLDLLAGWREAYERGDRARRDAMAYLAGLANTAAADTARADMETEAPALGAQADTELVTSGARAAAGAQAARRTGLMAAAHGTGARLGGSGPASAVVVFNTLATPRSGLATVTLEFGESVASAVGLTDDDGKKVAFLAEGVRRHGDGSLATATLTFRATDVPAVGYKAYLATGMPFGAADDDDVADQGWHGAEGYVIENEAFTVAADPARGGALGSIIDRRLGIELLVEPGNELVLHEEYPSHPRWGEGPWLLCTTGISRGSACQSATVRAERCPIGSRLVAEYPFDDLRVRQETLLWDGAERAEFRTHVDGSIGQDRLLRVRFPTNTPGGLPVFQTGLSVIGRPLGPADADVGKHTYTLDNPANEWFAISSTARVALTGPDGDSKLRAFGVAEVIAPAARATDQFAPRDSQAGQPYREAVKDLLVALARQGVTATCSVPEGARYGCMELDSNLPDIRIALGGPEQNAFTAQVLEAAGPVVGAELDHQIATTGMAMVWVHGTCPREQAFAAGADVRRVSDLPVIIVAGSDLAAAIAAFIDDLADAQIDVQAPQADSDGERELAAHSVALLNRGLPSSLVTPDGEVHIGLMRSCSTWPAGMWQDGEKRTVPDGSSFALQHWSHTFEYALAAGAGDWRAAGFAPAGRDYNQPLLTCVTDLHDGQLPSAASLATVTPDGVDLMALKPRGNPLAPHGQPDVRDGVTARLRDAGTGRAITATLRLFAPITSAKITGPLEEAGGASAECSGSAVSVEVPACGTVTLAVQPDSGAQPGVRAGLINGQPVSRAVGQVAIGHDSVGEGRQAADLPEPAQPVFTRYWLHGKGPAPAGNMPVAVHLSPTEHTLKAGQSATIGLTVACGPQPAAGSVTLDIPEGIALVSVARADHSAAVAASGSDMAGRASGGLLRYDLAANGFAAWEMTVQVPDDASPARHYLTASVSDEAGQRLEDAAVVIVSEHEPPPPDASLTDLIPHLTSANVAEAGEAQLEVHGGDLELRPGERGTVVAMLANNTASQLRGEAQLISSHGSWAAVTPWTQGFSVAPGGSTRLAFDVAIPAHARPGQQWWALVKVMYFGRLRYSKSVWIRTCDDNPA